MRRPALFGHRRRVVVGLFVAVGLFVVLGAVSAWRDLRPARTEILAAQSQLQKLGGPASYSTSEQRAVIRAAIATAEAQLTSARHRLERSPVIWVSRFVPGLRRQRAGLLDLVDDAQRGSATAAALIDRVESLPDRGQLRDGIIPLDSLPQVSAETRRAGKAFEAMQRSAGGLWGPLGNARRRLNEVAGPLATTLNQASDALGVSHGFLGGDGERRYLLAFQNNAEMRDQGLVSSYGILHLSNGRFQFERRGSIGVDGDLILNGPASTPIPPGTQEVFGAIRPTTLWQSVNATADVDWSGRAMADMYRQATGQTVDGVISIDVPGLAELLRAVGPVSVAGVAEPISADNCTRILLHDLYEGLAPTDSQSERRERLGDVAGAVIDRLAIGNLDVLSVGAAFGRSSSGGHMRLWSTVAAENEAFARTGLGGGPAVKDADRTFHLAVENRTATKLDYYVKPAVHQELRFSGNNDILVRTTVTIENQAPRGAPPSYQLGPDEFTAKPGDYLAWVLLWGPAGALQPASTQESGLTLSHGSVPVAAGERGEMVFDTLIHDAVRNGRLTLRLVPQPRMQPIDLTVTLDPGGRRVDGPTSWKGAWDRTRTMSWGIGL